MLFTVLFFVVFQVFSPVQASPSHIEILPEKKILLEKLRIHEHLILFLQLANFRHILEGPNKVLLATNLLLSAPFLMMYFLVIVLMELGFKEKAGKTDNPLLKTNFEKRRFHTWRRHKN